MNNFKTNIQKGFTLIELMIVIAIIGILLAIAIPAYGDYTIRARTTECLNNLSPLKTGVSEFVISNTHFPAALASFGTGAASRMCGPVTYTFAAAKALLTVPNSASTGVTAGVTVINLTGTTISNSVKWVCSTTGTQVKYSPASCR
ncbi:prepilin-type N-terminal cleavage/methylation domain-containing protein [Pseudolysobacter antarcticus]|uniref:Prepilin-type N-terminal cleavage/methylation domain-containing protein n=1 Tax=Pseudolysobacter antarcticus TaxID=2511995 RepID=A0A411HGG1_9GAMM|nr:pilin [Pseudolysobacter antarcticus]QBB69588.1 prepilin-type N-terminal cleavage/methylation domain-containing protein [Pseudolysobacter antarcticus]